MNPFGDDAGQVPDGPLSQDAPDREDAPRGGGPPDEGEGGVRGGGGGDALARVSVTVDAEHLASLPRVVEALRERGMRVEAVLEGLGIVTGSAPEADALRQVEGVAAVEPELEHHLPPPDDDVQ